MNYISQTLVRYIYWRLGRPVANLERRYGQTKSAHIRKWIEKFYEYDPLSKV
ncbi:MAG: hypothetical protein CM1200mP10_05290 [Candidatus Neomarinimicrobiota bacterium]|nr:MAG: hypothetical protein CM1200mP10_05290 [Candidatus Neomarinimicrobiota bacterium]